MSDHDPRPVVRVAMQFWVEIVPAREDYAMKYVGGATHEIWDPVADSNGERSIERFSSEDIAAALTQDLRPNLDRMWYVSRIAPALACQPHEQTPELERQAHQRYEQARAAGLSDPEARADGWPDRRAEGIAVINAEIVKWASEPESIVFPLPMANLAERLFDLRPAYCPYDCDPCHDDTCPCDRAGCAGTVAE
jgi:hypothetical protein